MKNLKFVLGFVTGAIVVYLFLYRPVKQQQNKEDAVLDEAMAMIDDYEAAEKATEDKRHRRLTAPLRPGNNPGRKDAS